MENHNRYAQPEQPNIQNAYRDLTIGFFVLMLVITVVRSMLKESFGADYISYLIPVFAPSMLAMMILAIRVIAALDHGRTMTRTIVVILLSAIILRVLSVIFSEALTFYLGLGSSLLLASALIIVVYRLSFNLFLESNHIIERLWASVCVYFIIGTTFASFYSIILIIYPDALGLTLMHPMEVYIYGMIYSLNVLSGFDPLITETSETIKMLAILESTVTTLFLVILIGRLLGFSQ